MAASRERIRLRDTTLREGLQIPGSRALGEGARRFVELLDELGVPEVEIGLPDGIDACADLARFIRQRGLRIEPSALVPCYGTGWRRQLGLAADCGLRVDVLAPVSDCLLVEAEHYGLAAEEILPRLSEVLADAAGQGVPAGAALMDACRAPRPRLLELVKALADSGAAQVVIYDSVGTMLPWRMWELVDAIRQVSSVPILVHCHNDHGMATANTLAALEAGAAAADVAVNGLGGRAGNAALEEVVMALERLCGRETGVNTRRLRELSGHVEEMTGLRNSALKPIVGRYCFAHAPVMHIRCIAGGNHEAFEPFEPELVGTERSYAFCLPVDYAAALEPFLRKAAVHLDPDRAAALLARLREELDVTEVEILRCIDQLRGEANVDVAGPDSV